MSDVAIVHQAGAIDEATGAQRCVRCGELLPRQFAGATRRWNAGDRVAVKPGRSGAYDIPAAFQLDDDEIECAGVVDVGNRMDA